MAGVFDSQYLLKSLRELTKSKNEIEDLSKWCLKNVASAKEIVRMWNTEYISLPPDRIMTFLDLFNDILHRSIEGGNRVFLDEFFEALPGAVDGETEYQKIVSELIFIWRDNMDNSESRRKKRKGVSEPASAALHAELKTLMEEFSVILESVDSSGSNLRAQVTTHTAEIEKLRKKFKEAEHVWRQLSGCRGY